jgi:dephospho-CoA kinase
MTAVANELRKNHHPAYIIEKLYEQAIKHGGRAIIESIRTPGEIAFLRKQGNFYLLAVDADPKIRYERIHLRASETDQIDFQTFLANEAREMNTTDPNKQNLSACIQLADFKLNNDGSMEELQQQLNKVLQSILTAKA